MRVTCPHCRKRHDVAHRDVLSEAARLAEQRKGGDVSDVGEEVNGNVLPPDPKLAKLKEAAIMRRLGVRP